MKANPHETNRKFWLSATIGLALLVMASAAQSTMAQTNTFPSTGNVGIGTTTPTVPLSVNGANVGWGGQIRISDSTWGQLTFSNSASTPSASNRFGALQMDFASNIFSIQNFGGGSAGLLNLNNAMYAGFAGNVGIGTSAPSYKLDLLGGYFHTTYNTQSHPASSIYGGLAIGWNRHPGSAEVNFYNVYDNAAISYQFSQKTGASTAADLMTILGNGNVGIGTASPQRTLDAGTSGQITFGDDGHTSSGSPGVYWVSGNAYGLYKTPGGWTAPNYQQLEMIFATGIVIDGGSAYGKSGTVLQPNGGFVGIGTTSPTYKLDVAGQIRSSTGGFRFPDGTVQTTAAAGGGGTITGVTAGAGLSGGGTSGAATLDIGQGTGVTVAADSISVNFGSTSGTAVEGNKQITITTDGSSGLSGGAALTVGSGGTLTLTNADKGSSQNIFKNVANASGATQFSAGSNTDSIRFAGTGGTSVTFDASTKKVTIDATGSTGSAANISAGQFGQNTGGGNYIFPGNVTVNGNIAAKYQDMAEWVPSSEQISSGTVVVLDSTKSNHVVPSDHAYDTRVAGVISEQPGIALGESGAGKVLVATTGRVLVNVDATKSPIHIGDLLVTSDVPGMAMKSVPVNLGGVQLHRPGTLIGKALEPLEKGSGKILVLLSLQ